MPDPDAEIQAIRVILPRPQNFRINVLGGGAQGAAGPPGPGASVTSTQIHNLVNTVSSRAVSISNELGSLLASTSAALESHINAVSAAGGGAGSMTSNEISALVQVASLAATNAELHANIVSARVVSVSNELGSLLASASAALEAHINVVSAAGVTGGASVTSNEVSVLVQIASAAATSADNHANTVSARVVSVSNELGSLLASASAALETHAAAASAAATSAINALRSTSTVLGASIQTASAAATSADTHANTVSARAASISNELGSLLASASAALETHINAVSAAGVTGGASVTSNELSILLAGVGGGTTSKVTGSDFTTSSLTLVDITGLTFSAAASKLYEVDVLLRMQVTTTAGGQFGMQYSAAGATGHFMYNGGQSATAQISQCQILGSVNAGAFGLVANTDIVIRIKGFVVTGANTGNITVQGLKVTSGTLTVYKGSRMTVTLLA